MSKEDERRRPTDPRIKLGACLGDVHCAVCWRPSYHTVYLRWPDGADQDYMQACQLHLSDVAGLLETKWRQRR